MNSKLSTPDPRLKKYIVKIKSKLGSEEGKEPKTQTNKILYALVGDEDVVLFLFRLFDSGVKQGCPLQSSLLSLSFCSLI